MASGLGDVPHGAWGFVTGRGRIGAWGFSCGDDQPSGSQERLATKQEFRTTDAHRWGSGHRFGAARQGWCFVGCRESPCRTRTIGVHRCASVVPFPCLAACRTTPPVDHFWMSFDTCGAAYRTVAAWGAAQCGRGARLSWWHGLPGNPPLFIAEKMRRTAESRGGCVPSPQPGRHIASAALSGPPHLLRDDFAHVRTPHGQHGVCHELAPTAVRRFTSAGLRTSARPAVDALPLSRAAKPRIGKGRFVDVPAKD